jgi:hypothetical protein
MKMNWLQFKICCSGALGFFDHIMIIAVDLQALLAMYVSDGVFPSDGIRKQPIRFVGCCICFFGRSVR